MQKKHLRPVEGLSQTQESESKNLWSTLVHLHCETLSVFNSVVIFVLVRFCQAVVLQSIQAGRGSGTPSGSVHAAAAAAPGAHL